MDEIEKNDLHTFRLQDLFDKRYVSLEKFTPIERIVFGAVGLMLSTLLVGLIYSAFHFPHV
jgi:hypothetical protein